MPREIPQPQQTLIEEIVSYSVHANGAIQVTTAYGESIPEQTISPDPNDPSKDYIVAAHFKIDGTRRPENLTIQGEVYEALLSDSPPWHPEKRGNMFEKNDLWYAINAEVSGIPLEHGSPRGSEHTPPGRPT